MAAVPGSYNDGNRAFLQAFMARGVLTFRDARPILAAIYTADDDREVAPEDVTQADFESYMNAASQAISFFDYEIRSTVHQVTKQRVHALVNTTSDPMTQFATTYTADELAFVKRLLDCICDTNNTPRMELMCIASMDATKLSRPKKPTNQDDEGDDDAEGATQQTQAADKGLKHSEVERMMHRLVSEAWLEESPNNFYSLTPRALMELKTWLVESYNDPDAGPQEWQRIKFCKACKEIVTHGKRCAERDCTFRLHNICEEAFWRTQRTKECPQCKKDWSGKHYVGEKAVTTTERWQIGRRQSGGGARGRGRQSNVADEGMDEDDEE